MAIKLPDPGNGIPEQKTGNDEWTNMKIVRDNFADKSNAASQLMTTAGGIVPTWSNISGVNNSGWGGEESMESAADKPEKGKIRKMNGLKIGLPFSGWAGVASMMSAAGYGATIAWSQSNPNSVYFGGLFADQAVAWAKVYTDKNTTRDGNGFLKAASPVVDLYDNKIELNDDAEAQGVEFIKNGKGDYTLKTKTGLRSDNTWRIEIPNDDNRNPLFAVDIDAQDDGTINIKCYKRIFNMQTFLFEPDLKEPIDITEGRFISVRLNDNPDDEVLDEPAI